MSPQAMESLRLFGVYTNGRFDAWMLAGPAKASCRAHIMSAYYGRKVPQREAGVTVIRQTFHILAFNCDAPGFKACECLATREDAFATWAVNLVRQS